MRLRLWKSGASAPRKALKNLSGFSPGGRRPDSGTTSSAACSRMLPQRVPPWALWAGLARPGERERLIFKSRPERHHGKGYFAVVCPCSRMRLRVISCHFWCSVLLLSNLSLNPNFDASVANSKRPSFCEISLEWLAAYP